MPGGPTGLPKQIARLIHLGCDRMLNIDFLGPVR